MSLGSDSSPYTKDSNSSSLFLIERMFKCKIDTIWVGLDVEGLDVSWDGRGLWRGSRDL